MTATSSELGSTGSASIVSASRTMAAGTIVSRLTGLLRASLLVAAIGKASHADIFNVANTIPNSLYILVAGGIFNAVLVPQLVRAIKNDPDNGEAYANRIITLGLLVLGSVTILLVAGAPLLMHVLSPHYFTNPQLAAQKSSLIMFARLCLPQVFFYGMYVLIGQILNARGRFGPMMWTPIANNIVSVAVLAGYLVLYRAPSPEGGYSSHQELLLGVGSTIGIVVQALLLVPPLRASGFRIRLRTDFRGTGLGHTLRLAKWTVGFVIVNQIAFYVVVNRSTTASSSSANGAGYTVYQNAFLLTQVPHSIITVSLATATMPLVSRLAAESRFGEVASEMAHTLRLVLSVIVPFAIALAVLGPALATVMFSYGAANGETSSLGLTIVAFAPGLLMFSIHYTLLRGFYSIEDNRTTFFIQCLVAGVNITLAILFTELASPTHAAAMLALAYGCGYTAGALVSARTLAHRLGGLDTSDTVRFVVRVAAAAVPAALLAQFTIWGLEGYGLQVSHRLDALAMLVVSGIVGLAVYLGLAKALHLHEIGTIVSMLAPRRRRGSASNVRTVPTFTMDTAPVRAFEQGMRREAGPGDVATPFVESGTVLADRYVVEDLLGEEGDATTWRARDRVLARSVVLQIIPSGSPAAAEMLDAAKQASRVADPRILQVLDAVDDGRLSYVVREWTNGQSLDVVLAEGPMSARRATFVMREVAGAISAAHKLGLRHQRLATDTIVLTRSSGVKVVGLGTLAALRSDPSEAENPELADTRDLGRLLYATLTARWPGGSSGALPAAPTEHGRLLRPRQVRAGVPRALDALCDRILGTPPKAGEPITTVDEVKNELSAILANDGFTDSANLRMSSQEGQQDVEGSEPPPAVLPRDDGGPTRGGAGGRVVGEAAARGGPDRSRLGRGLLWFVVLLLAVGVILLFYALALHLGTSSLGSNNPTTTPPTHQSPSVGQTPPTKSTTPPPAQLTPITIVSGTSFDPEGDGVENQDEVPFAFDGNSATTWNTLTYFGSPEFGGLKSGVGLVLDLGSVQQVSQVKLELVGEPTSLQIRAAPASDTAAPTGSVDDYNEVGSVTDAGTTATITLNAPVSTRYLLVWLTSLPPVTGGYEGKIAEIQVSG